MTAPLLELEGAVASRGAFRLGPVTLAVGAGRCVAVIGPNGAGKSTLLSLAAGDVAPQQGSARLGGDDASTLPRDEAARRVAVLAAGGAPQHDLRVMDLVLHGRWAHQRGWHFAGEADVLAAERALERVGASALASRAARTLSSGELQRVLLAKALAQEAPLVLLDEPAASLDLVQRAAVARLVTVARQSGLGVVVVTHDLEWAAGGCDEVVLLAGGRVVAQGSPNVSLTERTLGEAYGARVRIGASDAIRFDVGPLAPMP